MAAKKVVEEPKPVESKTTQTPKEKREVAETTTKKATPAAKEVVAKKPVDVVVNFEQKSATKKPADAKPAAAVKTTTTSPALKATTTTPAGAKVATPEDAKKAREKKQAERARKQKKSAQEAARKRAQREAKAKTVTPFKAVIGDITTIALATTIATVLFVPKVKESLAAGDTEAAADAVFDKIDSIENPTQKVGAVGLAVAADAFAHLPVANILLPAGLETVGTIAFTLLATKYLLAKDGDLAEDFDELLSSVPEDSPKNLKDVVDLVSPAVKVGSKIVKAAVETDVEEVADELKEAVEDLPETVQNIESPVEELGPTAAILGASYVTNRVAHASVLALSLPRLLELAGAGVLIYALGRYADDESDFTLREDLEDLKEETTRIVKKATGFDVDGDDN